MAKDDKKTTVVVGKVTPNVSAGQPSAQTEPVYPGGTAVAKVQAFTADHFLAPTGADAVPDGPYQPVAGYAQFVSARTKSDETKDAFKASGGKLPGFLLTEAGLQTAVQPFRFHLFAARLIWTKVDGGGKVIAAIDREPARDSNLWKVEKFRPHYYALVGVIRGDAIRPATVNGRNGLARCYKVAADRLSQLKTESGLRTWASGGEKYAASVQATGNRPSGMFIATASGQTKPLEDGSGFEFNEGKCTIECVSLTDAARFMTAVNSPNWLLDYGLAHRQYQDRISRVLHGDSDDADE